MQRVDGSIKIGTKVDTKGFNKGRREIEGGMKSLGGSIKRLGAIAGIALGAAAIVSFGRASVKAASELAAAMVGLESIMDGQGRSFRKAQKFINEYTADGLMPATQAITAYKNLALRGYDDSQIQRVMVALKDAAAFGRQNSLTLGEAVASATEGLKNENSILVDNAGVTKNVSKMWAEYARSIGVGAQSLTQQQKIQAEVNGILEESKYQTGDAAKMAGTYSGKVSGLSFAMYNLKVAIGNALIPALSAIIPHIVRAINWLTSLANTFAKVMNTIFGVKRAEKSTKSYAGATKDAAKAEQILAKQAGGVGKALKGANKEMSETLAGFDELNVLAAQDISGGAGSAGGGAPEATMPEIAAVSDPFEDLGDVPADKFEKLAEVLRPFQEISLEPLSASLDRLKAALEPFGEVLFAGLAWAMEHIFAPLAGFVIEEVLPRFFDTLAVSLQIFGSILEGLMPLVAWLFDTFLVPLAKFTADVFLATWDLILDVLGRVADWMDANPKKVQAMTGVVLGFFGAWEATKLLAFIEMSGGIVKAFQAIRTAIMAAVAAKVLDKTETAYLTALYAKDFLVSLSKSAVAIAKEGAAFAVATGQKMAHAAAQSAMNIAQGAWNIVAGIGAGVTAALAAAFAFLTSPIGLVVLAIGLLIAAVVLIVKHWDDLKEKALEVWAKIEEIWGKASGWFGEHVVEPIKRAFSKIPEIIKAIFELAWKYLIAPYLAVYIWFYENVLKKVIEALSAAPEKIGELFSKALIRVKEIWGKASGWFGEHVVAPLKSLFKGVANFYIDCVNAFIKGAIKGVNFLIKGLNQLLSVDVPDFLGGGKIGVAIPEIPVPKGIPRLAQGAVIPPNAEFLAVLGDQKSGRNIEAPEGLIRNILRSELAKLPEPNVNISASGSIAQLVRLLNFEIDREKNRKGKNLITGGANG